MEITKELLEQLVVKENKSFSEISRITKKNIGIISIKAKKYGIVSNYISNVKILPIVDIYNKYISGISLYSLHVEYKVPVIKIKKELIKNYPNLNIRNMNQAKRPNELNDRQYLLSCIESDKTFIQISKELNVKKQTVQAAFIRLGCELPKAELNKMYWELKYSIWEISQQINLSMDKIRNLFIKYGINLRMSDIPSEKTIEPRYAIDKYHSNWKECFKNHDECYNWLIEYGFQDIKFPDDILKTALNNLVPNDAGLNANYTNIPVVSLIKHFSPYIYKSNHIGYNPISMAWEIGNRIVLFKALEKIWNKEIVNIYLLVRTIGKDFKDFSPVSVFKPWVAATVYDKYLPKGGIIIDPCMGWGGRLLGCVNRNIQYIGYDLNPNSINSHNDLAKFINFTNCTFLCADSSSCDIPDGDLLFTSPPYDNCELYHGINSSETKTEPILDNIFRKFNKTIVLNVPKRQKELCIEVAKRHNRELIDELQMKTASFMGREKTFEPILVFK
jgi:hypothetical protein